jgi:hypothetical protein
MFDWVANISLTQWLAFLRLTLWQYLKVPLSLVKQLKKVTQFFIEGT